MRSGKENGGEVRREGSKETDRLYRKVIYKDTW